jgi:hypothetical protein
MVAKREWRRVARLTVALPLREGELAHHRVHLLNLSPLGARIAHGDLLHGEVVCYLDLPPAIGALRLTGGSCGPGSAVPSASWRVTGGPPTRAASSSPS